MSAFDNGELGELLEHIGKPEVLAWDHPDTFVINDVSLRIPPSSIQISKEDMVWRWKTLRTNAATKIPSGRGHNVIHVSIPFTHDMLLEMHRLVVEFRNSPFCYVENRYLRENLVPDWGSNQSMALTMTSLWMQPMAGAVDAWVMEIDFVWFNYFPYVDNYLFREDWVTVPLRLESKEESHDLNQYTIGWSIDKSTYEREPRTVRVGLLRNSEDERALVNEYSPTQGGYRNRQERTLQEMEHQHNGVEFDGAPLPSRMKRSKGVLDPKHSRIYVRYINNLQRDALWRSFGIDAEDQLSKTPLPRGVTSVANLNANGTSGGSSASILTPGMNDAVFASVTTRGVAGSLTEETWSLIDPRVPRDLRLRWISTMLEQNHTLSFGFNAYQEIRMPQEWTNRANKKRQSILDKALRKVPELVANARLDPEFKYYRDLVIEDLERKGWLVDERESLRTVESRARIIANQRGISYNQALPLAQKKYSLNPGAHELGFATDLGLTDASVGFEYHPNEASIPQFKDSVLRTMMIELSEWHALASTGVDPGPQPTGRPAGMSIYMKARSMLTSPTIPAGADRAWLLKLQYWSAADFATITKVDDFYREYRAAVAKYDVLEYGGNWTAHSDPFTRMMGWGDDPVHMQHKDWKTKGNPNAAKTSPEEEAALKKLTKDVISQNVDEISADGDIDGAEADELKKILLLLAADGWQIYEKDAHVTNLWQKWITIDLTKKFVRIESPELQQQFANDNVIVTSVGGGLEHAVANIPILSHEFPTQQFLGSVEPRYNIQFAILDDEGTQVSASAGLEGISRNAQMLETMRSTLQANGRAVRIVPDSWCVATDTFITRFFGSYEENDFLVQRDQDDQPIALETKKRTTLSRSSSGTVEGNPGLSYLSFEIEETNPYQAQKVHSTAPQRAEIDQARKEILHCLYNLDINAEFGQEVLPFIIAQLAQGDTEHLTHNIDKVSIASGTSSLVRPEGQTILVKDSTGFLEAALAVANITIENEEVTPGSHLFRFPIETIAGATAESSTEFVVGPAGTDDKVLGEVVSTVATIDIPSLLEQYPELGGINWLAVRDYWVGLNSVIKTAERILAEDESKVNNGQGGEFGMTDDALADFVYDLPVKPAMWRCFQHFLLTTVSDGKYVIGGLNSIAAPDVKRDGRIARQELLDNSNWLQWNTVLPLEHAKDMKTIHNSRHKWQLLHSGTSVIDRVLIEGTWDTLQMLAAWGGATVGGEAADADRADKTFGQFRDRVLSHTAGAHAELVNDYMWSLPISVSLPDWIRRRYKGVIGAVVGDFDGSERNKIAQLATMHDDLEKVLASNGSFTYWITSDTPAYQITSSGASSLRADSKTDSDYTDVELERGANRGLDRLIPITTGGGTEYIRVAGGTLSSEVVVGAPLRAPMRWETNIDKEVSKARYIQQILAAFADDMLADPTVLKAFGKQALAAIDLTPNIVGSEAYPDLKLPWHPYYNDQFAVDPDFYMWNIYEDGDAHSRDVKEHVYRAANLIVQNCYNSLKRMQKGVNYDPNQDAFVSEPDIDVGRPTRMGIKPEGSDEGPAGPAGTAFDSPKAAQEEEKKFEDGMQGNPLHKALGVDVTSKKAQTIRLDATRGSYGELNAGHALNAPARISDAQYKLLEERVDGVQAMFGSRSGYLKQYLNNGKAPDVDTSLKGTDLQRVDEYAVLFDEGSLKQLARDSSKDLFSQRRRMKRAYPTFKLFFIEEDEFETRYLNFDDFFTYNAIKEISVVRQMHSPADHAIIKLQNVSGTLDGTKRGVFSDLDYFASEGTKNKLDKDANVLSDDPVLRGTNEENPFGAVVLRPGLNVQLRLGYSNDPDNLEVMLSGRVVDVTWNKSGDIAEIMVQSFGTELMQSHKGISPTSGQELYSTTHQLLGSLMFEPEIVHFGRWEFGQLRQIGESKDSTLDFTDYSREGWLGRFRITKAFTQFTVDHPYITFGLALGLTLGGNFFPLGSFGRAGRFGRNVLNKLSVGSKGYVGKITSLGKNGFVRTVMGSAGKKIRGINTGTLYAGAARKVADKESQALISAALRNGATKEEVGLLTREMAERFGRLDQVARLGASGDDVLKVSAEVFRRFEADAALLITKNQWWVKGFSMEAAWSVFGAAGAQVVAGAANTYLFKLPKMIVAVAGATVIADTLADLISEAYNSSVGQLPKFFRRTKAQLFLSPQDDNLFPPHPKDYMVLSDASTFKRFFGSIVEQGVQAAGTAIVGDPKFLGLSEVVAGGVDLALGDTISAVDKRVYPESCRYRIISSTIWDMFYEMTLRHPGWTYGVRPYGKKFEYRMFFGVPSQRYWATPATNGFVARVNDLNRRLADREISETEYEQLYGTKALVDLKTQVDRDHPDAPLQSDSSDGPYVIPAQEYDAFGYPISRGDRSKFKSYDLYRDSSELASREDAAHRVGFLTSDEADLEDQAEFRETVLKTRMRARAMKEYLKSLELRFVPFRRYHMMTSDVDIVWNGLISSEQAVANAVEVTYFDSGYAPGLGQPEASVVIKAHSYIPEYMLRVDPMQIYPNCRGYNMALRYGMGQLIHRMKQMYRGEIVLLGNPRIRPCDVGILVDNYNDMIGPLEVDQVVHTFSHETGFLTEVKPAAIVIGNEISSWPMIEAAKTMALAITNIEANFDSKGFDFGTVGDVASWTSAYMGDHGNETPQTRRLRRIFGSNVNLKPHDIFPPGHIPEEGNGNIGSGLSAITALGGATLGAGGGVTALAGGVVMAKASDAAQSAIAGTLGEGAVAGDVLAAWKKQPATFLKRSSWISGGLLVAGGVLATIAGGGAMVASRTVDSPNMASLMAAPILFLQCMNEESIIVVPLMKNGNPIVSGLAYNDPAMIWKSFFGDIDTWVNDTAVGTRDMLQLWSQYGSDIWRSIGDENLPEMTGERVNRSTLGF